MLPIEDLFNNDQIFAFLQELTSNSFLEQTIQKLDTLNTLTNKMPRTD